MRRPGAVLLLIVAAACGSPASPEASPSATAGPIELWPLPDIELSDRKQIAIVMGEPPDENPSEFPDVQV